MKRKTSQRAAIEQVFCQLDRPLGIEEILETGRMAVESLNQATVYRNVKLLLEKRLAQNRCAIRPSARSTNARERGITIISTAGSATGCMICGCAERAGGRSLRVPRGGSRVFPVWGLPRLPRLRESQGATRPVQLVTLSLLLALFSTIFLMAESGPTLCGGYDIACSAEARTV